MQKENVETIINTCHSKLDLESSTHAVAGNKQSAWKIPYQVRDDVFINNGAFTLIELLVVVLIIGILAAVAVPQYQRAVEKSRAMQAVALLKTVGQATDAYFLANGTFPTSLSQLDIDIPESWNGNKKFYERMSNAHSNAEWSLGIENNPNWPAIYIGKLNGKYKGSGFIWLMEKPAATDKIKPHTIHCLEITAQVEQGSYCIRLFNGSLLHTDILRTYSMP